MKSIQRVRLSLHQVDGNPSPSLLTNVDRLPLASLAYNRLTMTEDCFRIVRTDGAFAPPAAAIRATIRRRVLLVLVLSTPTPPLALHTRTGQSRHDLAHYPQ